ncbi:hypothetical protein DBR39_13645 [Chryseobacterium sp. KBW03]|uniref:hypothetical protein n=1 Tax=Chryseobacterium sp. KBW03 TaxID=2153362 RepID=UPI000F5B6CE5|nr:hypothetical protein [Chryseobacterium sp. KBW03]RQO37927.1 hypothetical protein DBR39_13645 [Chryseobacterium sp. KBW03]
MIPITNGVLMIAKERQKQIDKHGFTAEYHVNHPEYYEDKQLIQATVTLLLQDLAPHDLVTEIPTNWDAVRFQDLIDRGHIERLTIAGALLAAELDRLCELACYLKCESCQKETDIERMHEDGDSNNFCPECWKELAPTMKADYEELKRNGEIE